MAIKAEKQSCTFLCLKDVLAKVDVFAQKKQRTRSNVIACILQEWAMAQDKARPGDNNG